MLTQDNAQNNWLEQTDEFFAKSKKAQSDFLSSGIASEGLVERGLAEPISKGFVREAAKGLKNWAEDTANGVVSTAAYLGSENARRKMLEEEGEASVSGGDRPARGVAAKVPYYMGQGVGELAWMGATSIAPALGAAKAARAAGYAGKTVARASRAGFTGGLWSGVMARQLGDRYRELANRPDVDDDSARVMAFVNTLMSAGIEGYLGPERLISASMMKIMASKGTARAAARLSEQLGEDAVKSLSRRMLYPTSFVKRFALTIGEETSEEWADLTQNMLGDFALTGKTPVSMRDYVNTTLITPLVTAPSAIFGGAMGMIETRQEEGYKSWLRSPPKDDEVQKAFTKNGQLDKEAQANFTASMLQAQQAMEAGGFSGEEAQAAVNMLSYTAMHIAAQDDTKTAYDYVNTFKMAMAMKNVDPARVSEIMATDKTTGKPVNPNSGAMLMDYLREVNPDFDAAIYDFGRVETIGRLRRHSQHFEGTLGKRLGSWYTPDTREAARRITVALGGREIGDAMELPPQWALSLPRQLFNLLHVMGRVDGIKSGDKTMSMFMFEDGSVLFREIPQQPDALKPGSEEEMAWERYRLSKLIDQVRRSEPGDADAAYNRIKMSLASDAVAQESAAAPKSAEESATVLGAEPAPAVEARPPTRAQESQVEAFNRRYNLARVEEVKSGTEVAKAMPDSTPDEKATLAEWEQALLEDLSKHPEMLKGMTPEEYLRKEIGYKLRSERGRPVVARSLEELGSMQSERNAILVAVNREKVATAKQAKAEAEKAKARRKQGRAQKSESENAGRVYGAYMPLRHLSVFFEGSTPEQVIHEYHHHLVNGLLPQNMMDQLMKKFGVSTDGGDRVLDAEKAADAFSAYLKNRLLVRDTPSDKMAQTWEYMRTVMSNSFHADRGMFDPEVLHIYEGWFDGVQSFPGADAIGQALSQTVRTANSFAKPDVMLSQFLMKNAEENRDDAKTRMSIGDLLKEGYLKDVSLLVGQEVFITAVPGWANEGKDVRILSMNGIRTGLGAWFNSYGRIASPEIRYPEVYDGRQVAMVLVDTGFGNVEGSLKDPDWVSADVLYQVQPGDLDTAKLLGPMDNALPSMWWKDPDPDVVHGYRQAAADHVRLEGTKVVDDNDKMPLLLYHATLSEEPIAKYGADPARGFIGSLGFWTTDHNYANMWASKGKRIDRGFINLQHPFEVYDQNLGSNLRKQASLIKLAKEQGYDGVIFHGVQPNGGPPVREQTWVIPFHHNQIIPTFSVVAHSGPGLAPADLAMASQRDNFFAVRQQVMKIVTPRQAESESDYLAVSQLIRWGADKNQIVDGLRGLASFLDPETPLYKRMVEVAMDMPVLDEVLPSQGPDITLQVIRGGDPAFTKSEWKIVGTEYALHYRNAGSKTKSWLDKGIKEWWVENRDGGRVWTLSDSSKVPRNKTSVARAFMRTVTTDTATPSRGSLIRDASDAFDSVQERTEYGTRRELVTENSFVAVWSNGARRWYISSTKPKTGQDVSLDANEVVVRAGIKKDASLIASKLPPLPLDAFSAENNPLFKPLSGTKEDMARQGLARLEAFATQERTMTDKREWLDQFMDATAQPSADVPSDIQLSANPSYEEDVKDLRRKIHTMGVGNEEMDGWAISLGYEGDAPRRQLNVAELNQMLKNRSAKSSVIYKMAMEHYGRTEDLTPWQWYALGKLAALSEKKVERVRDTDDVAYAEEMAEEVSKRSNNIERRATAVGGHGILSESMQAVRNALDISNKWKNSMLKGIVREMTGIYATMLDLADGDTESPFLKRVYNDFYEMDREFTRRKVKTMQWFEAKLNEVGAIPRNMYAKVDLAGMQFTLNDAVAYYLICRGDPTSLNARALMDSNKEVSVGKDGNSTPEQFAAVIRAAKTYVETNKEAMSLVKLIDSYYDYIYPELNTVYTRIRRKLYGAQDMREIGRIRDYFPMIREGGLYWDDDWMARFMGVTPREVEARLGDFDQRAKHRQLGATGRRIRTDVLGVFDAYRLQADNYIAKQDKIVQLADVFGADSGVAKAFLDKGKSDHLDVIRSFIEHERHATGRVEPMYDAELIMRKLRTNSQWATLVFNVPSWFRQPISALNSVSDLPHTAVFRVVSNLFKGMGVMMKNTTKPDETFSNPLHGWAPWERMVQYGSPHATSGFDQAESDILARKYQGWIRGRQITGKGGKGGMTVMELGMWPQRYLDMLTRVAVWDTAFAYHHGKLSAKGGMTEEQINEAAARAADLNTSKSQPAASATERNIWQKGPEYKRMMTMYTGQLMKMFDYMRSDVIQPIKRVLDESKGDPWKAMNKIIEITLINPPKGSDTTLSHKMFWQLVLPALAMGFIARMRPPKKWQEFVTDMTAYNISMVPILGPAVSFVVLGGGAEYGSNPAYANFLSTVSSVAHGFSNKLGDEEKPFWDKQMKQNIIGATQYIAFPKEIIRRYKEWDNGYYEANGIDPVSVWNAIARTEPYTQSMKDLRLQATKEAQ